LPPPLRELLLRLGELVVAALEIREALLEVALLPAEIGRSALGLRPAKRLGFPRALHLAGSELLLAPRQIGPHPLDLPYLTGIGEPVLDRREPAPLGAQRPQPPPQPPLAERELPLHLLELALADGNSRPPRAPPLPPVLRLPPARGRKPPPPARAASASGPRAPRPAGARADRAPKAASPLASNVHALCGRRRPRIAGNARRAYDQVAGGEGKAKKARVGRGGRARGGLRACHDGVCGQRRPDADQLRPVHEPDEPAPDAAR